MADERPFGPDVRGADRVRPRLRARDGHPDGRADRRADALRRRQRARGVLKPRRVFLGTTEVAGYFANLQRGLDELGVPTTYLDLSGHPFGYRRPSPIGRWGRLSIALAIRAARARGPARRLWRVLWLATYILQMPARIALMAAAVARHDVFILSSDTWVHRRLDLPLLRLFRKRIIVVFTGSDHRPPYLDGWFGAREATPDWADLARGTRRVRQRVATAERYADEIIALPASAHFHAKPIIDFLRVGIPFALPAGTDSATPGPFRGQGIRVLHSPSNPVGKGSDMIRAAIEQLRASGLAIDYVEIAGRPHREVLAALRDCDFVVDEVFSDTPMASFAAEAAAFGKPAVVTGYYAELIADELPPEAIPPTVFEMPDQLTAAIERLIVDEPFRRRLGERAQAFVSTHWNPLSVASRYLRIIDGDVPNDWRWDPSRQRYLYGWGMNRELVASTVQGLVRAHGLDGLGLSHAPDRERRILDAAGGVSQ